MEAEKRKIRSGDEFDYLFPKPKGTTQTIKRDANVSHTVNFIPKVVKATLFQTEKIAPLLKGSNLYETCRNIWQFTYDCITYEKDAHGIEQVRSPARTWSDRKSGVDCDCYTTFVSSILTNLRIPHTYRITKYKKDFFQHIYPIVPLKDGSYITIDCVLKEFNKEEPYTEKHDTPMDLQYLDGVENENTLTDNFNEMGSFDNTDLGELGRRKLFSNLNIGKGKVFQNIAKGKVFQAVKKGLHVINRINPATVLLRNGLLAAMKINMMKVAQNIKWGYLSEAEAAKRGIVMDKFSHLKKVLEKLEQIFFSAGGKPENLRAAILTGRGNSKGEVSGMDGFDENAPLSELLGELYYAENESLNGLGEPVTATAIAAASGAVASIAAIIKSIGSIFPKGKNEDGETVPNESLTPASEAAAETATAEEGASIPAENINLPNFPARKTTLIDPKKYNFPKPPVKSDSTAVTEETTTEEAGGENTTTKKGFWENNKKWLKPTGIATAGLATLYMLYRAFHPPKPQETAVTASPPLTFPQPVSGLSKNKKKKKLQTAKKGGELKAVELM